MALLLSVCEDKSGDKDQQVQQQECSLHLQLQWTQVLNPKSWVKLSALISNSSSPFLQPVVSYNFNFTAVCSLKCSSGSATPQFWLLFAAIGTGKLERV